MKILVTGGAGFIGSHLCELLLNEGHQVEVIDDLSTGSLDNISGFQDNPNFHFHLETIINEGFLDHIVRDTDQIYHLAAAVGVSYIIDNPLKSIQINVRGTENILEAAHKYNKKVLLTSTSEIYGKNEEVPLSEEMDRILGSTTKRRWSYSNTKALDEFLALAYHSEKKLPVVIVRLFNTVGPRQTGQYGMVIPRFVHQALLGKAITVYGDGEQTRCFCHVNDVVNALFKLMLRGEAEGEIYNIGSTEEISINSLARLIIETTKSNSKIKYLSYDEAYEKHFEDMRRRVPDITKINKLIGFEPKRSIVEIIKDIIEYYEKKH
ncbi:MAG TPA: NAD-dependent epimerase/dehydratase family protein [Firmicutes bacterium]|mgnify:CR=1 FL=1|nr:NAD-dependent epimerase/dehydratase family protein [Bacillota bacterium]